MQNEARFDEPFVLCPFSRSLSGWKAKLKYPGALVGYIVDAYTAPVS